MLGALGCVVPELLDGTNHIAWFNAGATIFSDDGLQYLGIPGLINAKSIVATLIVQVGCWGPIPRAGLCVWPGRPAAAAPARACGAGGRGLPARVRL